MAGEKADWSGIMSGKPGAVAIADLRLYADKLESGEWQCLDSELSRDGAAMVLRIAMVPAATVDLRRAPTFPCECGRRVSQKPGMVECECGRSYAVSLSIGAMGPMYSAICFGEAVAKPAYVGDGMPNVKPAGYECEPEGSEDL